VIKDSAGNFYGTTELGGVSNVGVVYKVDKTGKETVLDGFTGGADGNSPDYSGVIRDSAGDLYGTTNVGGVPGEGVVYEVDKTGQEKLLYAFPGLADGDFPEAGVIRDSAGNLYGTASYGGASSWGVVYRVNKTGKETVLYSFTGGADGGYPEAGVIRDSAGNLYGTTFFGGAYGYGVVYKVDKTGKETVLHSFTGGADGGYPEYAGVIRDSAGNLYGTAFIGGASGNGVVYTVDTADQETVLYNFTGGADGGYPFTGVIRDSVGNLYGTAELGGASGAGVVYKLDTAGQETVLYSFTGSADGGYPEYAGVIRDSAGNLYGTTNSGGASGVGVVYKVDTKGQQTVLYSFTGSADGSQPEAGLVRDSAGNLYGTTRYGGASGAGVVYKVDPKGEETVLYSFTGESDGAYPVAGVIRDSAGNLYGTASFGGTKNSGVVFEVKP
jgi:uncharacterized repeat protein (TIGR03803 family)